MQPQRGVLQNSFSECLVEIFEKPLPEFFLSSACKKWAPPKMMPKDFKNGLMHAIFL